MRYNTSQNAKEGLAVWIVLFKDHKLSRINTDQNRSCIYEDIYFSKRLSSARNLWVGSSGL
jgi:hypothetical protein